MLNKVELKSHQIGTVKFNNEYLNNELKKLHGIPFHTVYSEYALGTWRTSCLANKNGSFDDGLSYEYSGVAQITGVGEQFAYFISLIKKTFHWEYIKSIRFFSSKNNGMIIPHRDYLEFKKGFTRLHIPIQTDPLCLNSEQNFIYHMKVGEIWLLEGRVPHSAGSFGVTEKLSIVIDFDPDCNLSFLFKDKQCYNPQRNTEIVIRKKFDNHCNDSMRRLHKKINNDNFNEIVRYLTKIHFFRDVKCTEIFNWLEEICDRAENNLLKSHSITMRKYFIGED